MTARSPDEVFEVSVTDPAPNNFVILSVMAPASNAYVSVSAGRFWVVTECDADHFVESPLVIRVPAD